MSQVGWGLCLDGFASLSCFVDRVPEISQLGRMVALYEDCHRHYLALCRRTRRPLCVSS